MTLSRYGSYIRTYLEILGKRGSIEVKEYPESDRWLVRAYLSDSEVEYFEVGIYLMNDWLSFDSVILDNISGKQSHRFYEVLLRYSSFINGLKFAVSPNGEYVTLQTELHLTNLDERSFSDVFKRFAIFYIQVYPGILNIAELLGLSFSKKTDKKVDSMFDQLASASNSSPITERDYLRRISHKKENARKIRESEQYYTDLT